MEELTVILANLMQRLTEIESTKRTSWWNHMQTTTAALLSSVKDAATQESYGLEQQQWGNETIEEVNSN
jgi:hypothetical protein